MAVKLESFLVLEESLTDRISASWARKAAPTINKIVRAVGQGKFDEAYALVNQLDMAEIIKTNDKFIETAGMASILFGVSRVQTPKKSEVAKNGKPEALNKSTELMEMSMATAGTEAVRTRARKLIAEEEDRQLQLGQTVEKAATKGFVTGFKTALRDTGEATINIASSLHTSRLAQWGFTTEAELTGVTAYEVSEQLDGRTCPVCREMDGKVFPVSTAKTKLERWLSVDDPADLKTVAPWPKQDAASIQSLKGMTTSELIGAGYDTPPYHPRCRGVLVPASQASIQVTLPAPLQQFNLPQLREIAEDQGIVAVADLVNETAENNLTIDQLAALIGIRGAVDDADEVG